MAKYQARPFYEVKINKQTAIFDYFGLFETEDAEVIVELNTLVPAYIHRIDEPEAAHPKEEEPEPVVAPKVEQSKEVAEKKPEDKPKTRKTSAK
ncbi:hypothetical protein M5X04_27060 [Paenibacillus alvei]|uniref:Uncharacterized protein n=1 Tax=Paenibacillus alvei TaxID=44250 RepID=A0ABT4EGX5_PAEAL|nr:hypothetical protein [Paenibacillus alvei]MCY9532974.1 hypothetical protein [Paenibacillus alvei]